MKQFWFIIAFICVVVAGVSLLRQHTDVAFVVAAAGAVAWFLNYRIRLKELTATTDAHETDSGEMNESDED